MKYSMTGRIVNELFIKHRKRWAKWRWPVLLVSVILGGCATLDYYGQSIGGQWEVLDKRQPIEMLLALPDTPAPMRKKLQAVLDIRDFSITELALPDNDSYRSYADLQRPFVVWNVFATKPFEVSLQTWCFPFAGCVGYRGYFAQEDALAFAKALAANGQDVYVGGVSAYSTLGWFDDPMLNTIIGRSTTRIAGLIFHELAHQVLYIEGDTAFNEGFATTVQLEGVRRWLAANGDEQQGRNYGQFLQRQNDFVKLVGDARDRLQQLYTQTMTESDMRTRKAAMTMALRIQYQQLKKHWGGDEGYDRWFAKDLNNAQLAAVTTYQDYVPGFQRLLAEQGGDIVAFYQACAALGELSLEKRTAILLRE